jgi:speckle-type POZ protein
VIEDMRADVFRNLLHFIYTDTTLPEQTAEEGVLMAQHLLVAADRYGMERLKIICENKLCRHIDVSTLATTLALAEQHRCQGLKDACFEFLKAPGALDAIMATDGFDHLAVSCPSLIKELMSKLAAR